MATARELLEQVDALMRRNREEAANADIPVLTDVVDTSARANADALGDAQRWDRLAEDVLLQVLQDLDVFVAGEFQRQVKARLQPVVERMGAELVDAAGRELVEILRGHLAQAIEHEIARSRDRSAPNELTGPAR